MRIAPRLRVRLQLSPLLVLLLNTTSETDPSCVLYAEEEHVSSKVIPHQRASGDRAFRGRSLAVALPLVGVVLQVTG